MDRNDLLLRALLLLYPRGTRRWFGDEMLEMWRYRRKAFPGSPLRFWVSAVRETLYEAPAAHFNLWAERLGRRPSLSMPRPERGPVGGDGRRRSPVGTLFKDVRHGIRALFRNPGFTATAVLVLAIGIGANTAVFSLLHTILIQPLPFPEPDRLLVIESTAEKEGVASMPLSYADLKDLDELTRSFSGIAGAWHGDFTFTGDGRPERIRGSEVTANFTEVMGVDPILGRSFRPEEEGPDAPRVILISAWLWQTRYGGDPDIVGKVVTTGGAPSTIVGVMPPHFHFPENTSVWAPFRAPRDVARGNRIATGVGRLAPGVSVEAAEADLGRVTSLLADSHSETNQGVGARVERLQAWVFGEETRPVAVFYGVVTLILFLACANVAGLLLARNEARRTEVAVRAALGAGRGRIARQLLTEGLLLAGLGGAAGLAVGWIGRELILLAVPGEIPPFFMTGIEPGVLVPIAAIILFSGLLFGMAPALSLSRTNLTQILPATRSDRTGRTAGPRARSLLVAAEVALALTILTGANLMLKSVLRQRAEDPGFDRGRVATLYITLPDAEWEDRTERLAFFRDVLGTVGSMPGVKDAALASELPTGTPTEIQSLWVGGDRLPQDEMVPRYPVTVCGAGYFRTLGIPLLDGRDFDERDGLEDAPDVVIVNESFARRHWPGERALGKRVAMVGGPGSESQWFEVVGVVGDVQNAGFGRTPKPGAYFAMERHAWLDMFLLAKTESHPHRVLESMRDAIWDIDSTVPLSEMSTLEQEILRVNWHVPTFSWAFGVISLIGLILAATGVYGIMAFSVSLRSREYALRMAVGAEPRSLRGSVLRGGLALAAAGVVLGLVLSLASMPLLRDLLFEVSPTDLGVYGLSAGVVVGVALVASYLPAIRATSLDPMQVLGRE